MTLRRHIRRTVFSIRLASACGMVERERLHRLALTGLLKERNRRAQA